MTYAEIPLHINPVLIQLGNLSVRWYGIMFFGSILAAYLLCLMRIKKGEGHYTVKHAEDYYFWAIWGVVIGGRLGYVIFYDLQYYLLNPIEIALPFSFNGGFHFTGISGMSFHGGLLGVIIATYLFCKKYELDFLSWIDFNVICVPAGYTLGRIGNFLNSELYGRVTDSFLGMYFPTDASGMLRHPSQLYEALFEGVVLFAVLWSLRNKPFKPGSFLAFYLIGYGLVRFFIEYTREPDAHLGFVFLHFSMGQMLCLGMIAAGLLFLLSLKRISKAGSS